jgi:putative dimethyl sulfoxide reductase chaperone
MSTTSASTVPEAERGNGAVATPALRAAADRDAARADLCRYLAACYYIPDAAFGEERLFESMACAAATLDPALATLARRLGEAFARQPLDELLVDHTRLFLGPVQAIARPYASVWLSGADLLMQDSTMALLALYAEGGFELDEGFFDLPDHVAAELEFLYLLIHRDNVARWGGHLADQLAVQSLRQRFLHQHLGHWLGPFLLAMHDGAETAFYETLAELTEAFVRIEAQAVLAPA